MVDKVIFEMIKYFRDDSKRINHALKVFGFSEAISSSENLKNIQKDTLLYSAILHDIGIKESERKYNSTAGKYQESEGPLIAKDILNRLEIPEKIINRVCFIIGHHHTYNAIDDIDFQILVEADFLVNIFEDEIKKESIESISNKYFTTSAGKKIIESMYIN